MLLWLRPTLIRLIPIFFRPLQTLRFRRITSRALPTLPRFTPIRVPIQSTLLPVFHTGLKPILALSKISQFISKSTRDGAVSIHEYRLLLLLRSAVRVKEFSLSRRSIMKIGLLQFKLRAFLLFRISILIMFLRDIFLRGRLSKWPPRLLRCRLNNRVLGKSRNCESPSIAGFE